MGNYGTQKDHKKAWLLLDNSSTHYVDGLEAKVWEADGFQFEGFIMSHTNILFLPPNTTSKIQPLDAGIIACWKAHCRNLQINYMLTVLEDLPDCATANGVKIDIKQAIIWAAQAWKTKVTCQTIQNCWRKTKLLPVPSQGAEEGASAIYMEEEVIPDDDLSTAMTDLANAILALSRYQNEESCEACEFVAMESEKVTEDLESSSEEEEPAAATVSEDDEIDPDDEEIAEISSPRVRRVEARRHLEPVFSFLLENPNIPGQAAHLRAIRDLMFVLEQADVAGILARTGQVSIDSYLINAQGASGSHSAV